MKRFICSLLCICFLTGCSLKKSTSNDFIMLSSDTDIIETSDELYAMMNEIMEVYGLNEDNFALFYENLMTHESYEFNVDTFMLGASTVKVPINMMYYDTTSDIEETSLLYEIQNYEEGGGSTSSTYEFEEYIPLSYLMEQSIVYSDNTAINIMLEALGFSAFKEYYADFINVYYDDSFYNENLTSANLLHAVSVQLYEQRSFYGGLLDDMLEAMPNRYMKKILYDVPIAHKYGFYDSYEHDFGIVYASQPFSLSILTNDLEDAEDIIALITYAFYTYQENQQ